MNARTNSSKPFVRRPWIGVSTTVYALYSLESTIHADLYAYEYQLFSWFMVEYSYGGKQAPMAVDWFMYAPEYDVMLEGLPVGVRLEHMRALRWTRDNAATFNRVHRALVTRARANALAVPDALNVTAHCHYIRVPDHDPWPRGFVNYAHMPAPERARLTERPKRSYTRRAALPDWL